MHDINNVDYMYSTITLTMWITCPMHNINNVDYVSNAQY